MADLNPLFDFTQGAIGYRLRQNRGWNEQLVKALKISRSEPGTVIDCTAGLGRDMFILASLGCQVLAFERNPIIFEQLQLALEKASETPDFSQAAQRIKLYFGTAADYQSGISEPIWAVYCDPMFPEREKSAAVKKEAAFLHQTVGEDADADQLLESALKFNPKRVVIKRSKNAPFLLELPPHHQIKSDRVRFDIYYPQNMNR